MAEKEKRKQLRVLTTWRLETEGQIEPTWYPIVPVGTEYWAIDNADPGELKPARPRVVVKEVDVTRIKTRFVVESEFELDANGKVIPDEPEEPTLESNAAGPAKRVQRSS